MLTLFSINGRQRGIRMAQIIFDRKVYDVISSRSPPSFCVTTAAAVAQGQMIHVRIASSRTSPFPVT